MPLILATLAALGIAVLVSLTSRDAISAAGMSPRHASACDSMRAGWIWCDDFEQDRLGHYFEYDSAHGAFVREAGAGRDGSYGMRARFAAHQESVGSLKLAFGRTPGMRPVDAGTARYRDIYWRFQVMHEPGWIGGGGRKLTRATSFASARWTQAMIAHVWSSKGPRDGQLVLDPASGMSATGIVRTTRYNDFQNLRWLGSTLGIHALFSPAGTGRWHCVEAHVRLNTPGATDGVFELWVDNQPDARRDRLDWVGTYGEFGINAIFLENFWNDGAPRAQARSFDDFVVSTRRIQC